MDDVFETVAYHKNDLSTAKKNTLYQTFFISVTTPYKDLWLGSGIYFWERKEDAIWWDGRYEIDTILSAKLSCPLEQYINLDDKEVLQSFLEYCENVCYFLNKQDYVGIDFQNGNRQLMSVFANTFKDSNDILLMKYSFPKENNRPQYCASDNSIISDIHIVASKQHGRMVWC